MQSFFQLYRFLLGHNFAIGLQKGIGIFIPTLLAFYCDVPYSSIVSIGFAAMAMSTADQMDTFNYKVKEMGVNCALIIIITACICYLQPYPLITKLVLLAIIFLCTLLSVFGNRANAFGLSLIFIALITYNNLYSIDAHTHLIFTIYGALTYYLYALFFSFFTRNRLLKQSLADCYFHTSNYLRSLSECYRQNTDLSLSFSAMIEAQSILLEKQQTARELIFSKNIANNITYAKYATELLTLIDMQERMMLAMQDFVQFRTYFANSDIQVFFRDLTEKAANNLEGIAFMLLGAHASPRRLGFKAELRALEYEIELQKQLKLETTHPEIYLMLTQHYRKAWGMSRQIKKLHNIQFREEQFVSQQLSSQLNKFTHGHTWAFSILWQHLKDFSPTVKHALRLTLAVASSLVFIDSAHLISHGFWIVFTIIFVMRSSFFSITRQRTQERIIGTLLGCVLTGIVFALQVNVIGLIVIMFACIVLNNGLTNVRYDLSTAFNCVYVLLASSLGYSYGYSSGFALASERIIDTLIAAIITILFSFFLPSWEKNSTQALNKNVLNCLDLFIQKINTVFFLKTEDSVEYRLARKQLQYALSNQINSFHRMQKEPKNKQGDLEELRLFIFNHQALLAELTHLAYNLKKLKSNPKSIEEFYELFQLIAYQIKIQATQESNKTFNYLHVKEVKPLIWHLERTLKSENSE